MTKITCTCWCAKAVREIGEIKPLKIDWSDDDYMRGEQDGRNITVKEINSLISNHAETDEKVDPLKEFARWVIREGWRGDVCGAQIQGKGEKLGLLSLDTIKKEDLDGEYCREYYSDDDVGEATIYCFTDILAEPKDE